MDLFKKILIMSKLAKAKITKSYFPFFVMFNITNRCNLKCSYCFSKFYERKNEELSTGQIFSLVDELAELGVQRIAIGGGEPLIRNDLPQIIQFIKSKGIECGLNSNGILVPNRIKEIGRIDSICISFDGPEKIHDYYRGRGSWQRAVEAIRAVKNHKIPLHLSAVITGNNCEYMDYILSFAKKEKILVEISPLYNQFYGEKNKDFPEPLSRKEYYRVVNKILDYKLRGYPVFYSRRNYLNVLRWPDYRQDRIMDKIPDFKYIKCWAGKYMCSIEANGDVYPCGYFVGHRALNCRKHGFREAFANINNHNCRACLWACYSEFNLLLNLDISALLNQFNNLIFERRH